MLTAQLRGKIPTITWITSEDLLTSAVFGTLKNLSASWTANLFHLARPLAGSDPPTMSSPLCWHFWPWWTSCEPDIVIEDQEVVYVLEAKLYSDFSEKSAGTTQLAQEWREGLAYARKAGKQLWLLAVTNHAMLPHATIRHQLRGSNAEYDRVCWMSWYDIGRFLQSYRDNVGVSGWFADVLEVLSRMGLAPFDGFAELLAEAADLQLALGEALWAKKLFSSSDDPILTGFGQSIRSAALLAHFRIRKWVLHPISVSERVGFEPAIKIARMYIEEGATLWQLKMM